MGERGRRKRQAKGMRTREGKTSEEIVCPTAVNHCDRRRYRGTTEANARGEEGNDVRVGGSREEGNWGSWRRDCNRLQFDL